MDKLASSHVVRSLALFQLAFRTGHEDSLIACIALCHRHQIPLPQWAIVGTMVRLDADLAILGLSDDTLAAIAEAISSS